MDAFGYRLLNGPHHIGHTTIVVQAIQVDRMPPSLTIHA